MVGVPGKYKGCETCRRRRVKCDNTRPLCRKCLNNGRECEGYHRDRVFITAGVEQGGRCSSHPPRRAGGSGSEKSKSGTPEKSQQPHFTVEHPSASPAWDGVMKLSSRGSQHAVHVIAFHADMARLARVDAGGNRFTVEGAAYSIPDFRMPFGEEFDIECQCLLHISGKEGGTKFCIFVFEHSSTSLLSEGMSSWGSQAGGISAIRSQGPQAFQEFPAHHFFARIYRPHAIGQALLNRCGTFLETREWTTTPWTTHPKTALDNLLDTLSCIPDVLSRTDTLLSTPVTQHEDLQDLLATAHHIEQRLGVWYGTLMPGHWFDDRDANSHIPFGGALSFRDLASALACIYYWTGLLLFHPCVLALRRAAFPPYGYQADEARYMQGRQLAGKICQSLDFAVRQSPQPDLLAVPLAAVESFYRDLEESSGYGSLELVWCDGFREKLALRGQYLAGLLQDRKLAELARF